MTVLNLQDERLERQLKRPLKRIEEAQDAETKRVLWGDYTALHGTRTPERVRDMEERSGIAR